MSAERRLRIWNSEETDSNVDNNDEINANVKGKMMKVIEIALAGEGLENLRTKEENIDVLQTLVSYCLIHFTTSINWRYKACSAVVSDIFTESDEAFCILLIENNAGDYAKMHREQRKISRKESKPKYTKVECVEHKFKGWDRRGIRRFNNIVTAVRKNRELSASKNMELELKSRYTEVSGKATDNNEDEVDYDSDLDELNGYDGFAGVTESNNETVENMANGVDLNECTNITAL